jgi:hypothetical protein
MQIPYEIVTGEKARYDHLRLFGCTAFVHIDETLRTKLADRATRGVYVGHDEDSPSYRILVPETGKVLRSGQVRFIEETDKY